MSLKEIIEQLKLCKFKDEIGHPLENNTAFKELEKLAMILDNPIIEMTINQQQKGIKKYGETVTLESYDVIGWLEHAAEEAVDKLVYLNCLREKLKKEKAE